MNYSENYNFALIGDEDGYDIAPLSENFKTLDEILSENESAMEEVSAKIGSPADTGKNTVFGCLNSGGNSTIKSIHKISVSTTANTTATTYSLATTVDPDRCIVIVDRMYDRGLHHQCGINYELKENSLTVSAIHVDGNYAVTLQFQIIEFC